MSLSRARAATVALMALRVAYGTGLIAAPARLGRRWLGPASATAPTQVPLQGLGMREIGSELPSGSAVATAAVGGGSALLSGLLLVAVDR